MNNYKKFYTNQFENAQKLSIRLSKDYEKIKQIKTLIWLDVQIPGHFDAFFENNSELKSNWLHKAYESLKKCVLTDDENKNLSEYVLLEYIVLQKQYSLIPELLILESFRTYVIKDYDEFVFLRYLNLSIKHLNSLDSSLEKYKESIIYFVDCFYNNKMSGQINFTEQKSRTFVYAKCNKAHKDRLFIFIMNICSGRKSDFLIKPNVKNKTFVQSEIKKDKIQNNKIRKGRITKNIKNNVRLRKEKTSRFCHFYVTCCSLLYNHLMLNVIVQNKDYDIYITIFLQQYSSEDKCIACMIADCFKILSSSVIQDDTSKFN